MEIMVFIKASVLCFQKTKTLLKAPSIQEGWTRCLLRCSFQTRSSGWSFEFQNTRVCVVDILYAAAVDKQDAGM
jgi:hypothetical protein